MDWQNRDPDDESLMSLVIPCLSFNIAVRLTQAYNDMSQQLSLILRLPDGEFEL